ncbi:hypothetical protein ACIGW8_22005 [Streptomyces sioyaensis]|uniref:hypothetical protein n=1 Tax=Streptomyces sioyaensis TaxID=67364 RepID=UPI0037D15EA8
MDATTIGSVLALAGVLSGGVVAFLGKRGENAVTGYTNLTQDLQEERNGLRLQLTEQHVLRAADQAELARLRALVIHLGGQP